jgi:hypothetical protein
MPLPCVRYSALTALGRSSRITAGPPIGTTDGDLGANIANALNGRVDSWGLSWRLVGVTGSRTGHGFMYGPANPQLYRSVNGAIAA